MWHSADNFILQTAILYFLSVRWEYMSWAVVVFYIKIKKKKRKKKRKKERMKKQIVLYSWEEEKQESYNSPWHHYLVFCLNSPSVIALKVQPLNCSAKYGSSSLELHSEFLKDTLQARKDWKVYNFTSINNTDKLPVTRMDVTKYNSTGY